MQTLIPNSNSGLNEITYAKSESLLKQIEPVIPLLNIGKKPSIALTAKKQIQSLT